MKHIFVLIFGIFAWSLTAQVECEFTRKYTITAESGMKMRAEPKAGTPVVTYVMHDSVVTACDQSFGAATFEEIDGDWRRVNYKGKVGYMFDGFLTRIDQPVVTAVEDSAGMDSLTTLATDTIITAPDSSAVVETVIKDTIPEEPAFVWERTERDEMPATGRLDQTQIRALATALRTNDLRMDSLIGFLHKLPTKGSQDSVIAWVDAGMPGGVRKPKPVVSVTQTEQRPTTATQEVIQERVPVGPAPIKMQLATEVFNYCGDIGVLDPSMNWYGIFVNEQMGSYRLQSVDIEILLSQSRLSNKMEFDIRNSTGEVSHFLFAINRKLDTVRPYQLSPDRFLIAPSKLFPGQQLEAYAYYNRPSAANVFISATGRVLEVGACPVIEDYALYINTQGPTNEIRQDITPLFPSLGKCGMPEMFWFGDLNGDNYPELIYVSATAEKNDFTLLMSNTKLADGLYELGAVWTIERCK